MAETLRPLARYCRLSGDAIIPPSPAAAPSQVNALFKHPRRRHLPRLPGSATVLLLCLLLCCRYDHVWGRKTRSEAVGRAALAETPGVEQFRGQLRLPKFAVPRRYGLRLAPDLVTSKFAGAVEVTVDVVGETRFLVLNAADLEVAERSVSFRSRDSSQELRPSEVVTVVEDEILVLAFDRALPLGEGVLRIAFSGTLNDKMRGFYRSTYELNGEKTYLAATQLAPVDARRCFPCWDEPALKATFKITLEVPHDLVALSNMPVTEEKQDGPMKTVFFQESPAMSTYLVAVVVGLLDYVEDTTSDGTKVRVYCRVGKSSQGNFALDFAVKTLDLYKRYLDMPYPLPKLDMVAIPDFAIGGMENFGLLAFKEIGLLYDDRHSDAGDKQRVAITVAHELAHQWFGNLVTMEWWTHLWLHEGFATWASYLATDSLFPEWKMWTQFLDDETSAALRLDALAESHPIEVDINRVSEIVDISDDIPYKKGASIIRMLQKFLGAEHFQRALASYIKRYAYANVKTEDLWAVIEEESDDPVRTLMNSWTKQKGYPLISVKIKDDQLELEQAQFLLSGSSSDGQWIVPITIYCGSYDAQKDFLLKTSVENLHIRELGATCLGKENQERIENCSIKLNIDQTGFYRVKYDNALAAGVRSAIEVEQLAAADRFGILDDSYALCVASKQTLSSLLLLVDSYREELDYTVLSRLITISSEVMGIAAEAKPKLLDDIKHFFINLFQFSSKKLGWDPKDGESHLDAMLRGELLTALVAFGHDSTREEALKRFAAFLNDRSTSLLPLDTRRAAYVAVMQNVSTSNRSGYEALLRVYRETDSSQEKAHVLASLASAPDPEMVLEALNFLLSSEVRSQDTVFGLLGVSGEGQETAWQWLKDNWDQISERYGSGYMISFFISNIISPFSSDEKANEIEKFFSTRTEPSFARALKQSIERVRINSRWIQNVKQDNFLRAVVKKLANRKI